MQEKIENLKKKLANGVSPAMATPLLNESGLVNTGVVPQLVDFLIAKGVKGLFVGGSTGEGILLSTKERKKLLESALTAVNGRVPVLAHIGAMRNEITLDLAKHAALAGVDAVGAVTPIFYGMHDLAIKDFYAEIATAVPDTPLFGYDIPHMAVNGISPNLAARLCTDIPSFAGLKTSNQDLQKVRRLIEALPEERIILVGSEGIALGSLAMGADGMISGLSTAIPEPFVTLTRAFANGDLGEAREQQRLVNCLLAEMPAGARIGGIKSILAERGVPVGPPVAPLPLPDQEIWPIMQSLLAK